MTGGAESEQSRMLFLSLGADRRPCRLTHRPARGRPGVSLTSHSRRCHRRGADVSPSAGTPPRCPAANLATSQRNAERLQTSHHAAKVEKSWGVTDVRPGVCHAHSLHNKASMSLWKWLAEEDRSQTSDEYQAANRTSLLTGSDFANLL